MIALVSIHFPISVLIPMTSIPVHLFHPTPPLAVSLPSCDQTISLQINHKNNPFLYIKEALNFYYGRARYFVFRNEKFGARDPIRASRTAISKFKRAEVGDFKQAIALFGHLLGFENFRTIR